MENINEVIKLAGSVHVELIGPDGKIKQQHTDHNLIVTVGKTYLAAWLAAASQAGEFMSYIALGSGTNPAALSDTTLQTEFTGGGNSRSLGALTSSSNTWNNTATFAPGNCTGAVTEAGLLSASSVGTLFARQVFAAYNKAAGDTLTVSWTVTLS
jgi:hypothetical protein